MSDLTLYQIEAELADLVNLRDQLAEAGEDVAPCEQAIKEYCARELRKVDGIRAYIRHAEMMASAAKAEAAAQLGRATAWQNRIDRLKEFCRSTMETWGAKRLDGSKGSILLQVNGGRQAVTITDASLIPEDMVQYTGTISGVAWKYLLDHADIEGSDWSWFVGVNSQDVQMERIPHKGRIGEALAAPCQKCNGRLFVTTTDGNTLPSPTCYECDGDGHARVPGARLEPRGNHVTIK